VPYVGRPDDALGAVEVFAQPLDPDPPVDQPQDVGAGVVGVEHDACEVDEPPDRGLGVAAAAALEHLALALRGAVG
jgi:hypothetical protein